MQGKEYKGGNHLHHELVLNDLANRRFIPNSCHLIKQPATDKEETGHTQQEQHIVEGNEVFLKTEHTNMRVNHKNHCKSPHRINIFYPFFCHLMLQRYEIFRNFETKSRNYSRSRKLK